MFTPTSPPPTAAEDTVLPLLPKGMPLEPAPKENRFCWPSPPYAIYSLAEPWSEPQACELEDLNGSIRRDVLWTIAPAEKTIWIQIEHAKKPVPLAFSQFRRLTLEKPIHPQAIVSTEQFADILSYSSTVEYHLQRKNGSTVSGMTVGFVETQYGLFVFTPFKEQGSVVRVFIPREAYLSVSLGGRIGQLLVEQKAVTPEQVEQAASEQHTRRTRKLGDYLVETAVVSPDQLLLALDQQSKMPMIRIGEVLKRLGYVDDDQLSQALERQKIERTLPLGQLLINMGFLTRGQLVTALARKMGYPVVDVAQFPVESEALKKISMTVAQRLGVMPLLSRPGMTVVAAADPTRREMLDELEFLVQGRVIAALGDEHQIKQTIETAYDNLFNVWQFNEYPPGFAAQTEAPASSSQLLESMELTDKDSD